jgi:hypothetical protein
VYGGLQLSNEWAEEGASEEGSAEGWRTSRIGELEVAATHSARRWMVKERFGAEVEVFLLEGEQRVASGFGV